MSGPFADAIQLYLSAGLSPVPLGKPGSGNLAKAAKPKAWQQYCERQPTQAEVKAWLNAGLGANNIGLCMGTVVYNDMKLVGIDIDRPDYQEKIERAIGKLACGKQGFKGATWFALSPPDIKSISFTLPNKGGTMVDLISKDRQTAVPPSIHPDSGEPYIWLGTPLHEMRLGDLPVFNHGSILELQAIAAGKDQFFNGGQVKEGEYSVEVDGINNMVWAGDGGGGTTHENRLKCSAHMVAMGWSLEDAVARLNRAMEEAYERSEMGEEPDWDRVHHDHTKMVEGAIEKGYGEKTKGGKPPKVPPERVLAAWASTYFDPLVCVSEQFRKYKDGHWPKMRPETIKKAMFEMDIATKNSDVNSAVSVMSIMLDDEEFGKHASSKICLQNGTLDTETGQLMPHDPEHQVLHQLDFEWEADGECPVYDKFIDWALSGDVRAIETWDEYAGLTLVDDLKYQKMMFLVGPGANGKSTIAKLIELMHNPDAVSTVPITKLDDERHLTSLVGALINISTEQSRLNTVADAVFKQVVGGDPVSVRKLYSEVENKVTLKARLLCLANELPALNDSSFAMKRRMIILPFSNIIPDDQKDPDLIDKLKAERPAILRRWVAALQRLRARGKFDEPDSSTQAVDAYLKEHDSVAQWLDGKTQPLVAKDKGDTDKWPTFEEAYIEYADYAKDMGYRTPYAMPIFKTKVRNLGVTVATDVFEMDGISVVTYRLGLKFGGNAVAAMKARL